MEKNERDIGMTSLPVVGLVSKSSLRIHSLGEVDELSSHIGLLTAILPESCSDLLQKLECIQRTLFATGAVISGSNKCGKYTAFINNTLHDLEQWKAAYEEEAGALSGFIIPSGHTASCQAHICRSVCRRTERSIVSLCEQESDIEDITKYILPFINTLSNFFFTVVRVINKRLKIGEKEYE